MPPLYAGRILSVILEKLQQNETAPTFLSGRLYLCCNPRRTVLAQRETAGIPPWRNDDILVIAAGSTDFDSVEVAYSSQVPSIRLDQERPMEEIIFKTSVRTSAG